MRWQIVAVILFGILITACGNKGPLVMPDKDENAKRELIN